MAIGICWRLLHVGNRNLERAAVVGLDHAGFTTPAQTQKHLHLISPWQGGSGTPGLHAHVYGCWPSCTLRPDRGMYSLRPEKSVAAGDFVKTPLNCVEYQPALLNFFSLSSPRPSPTPRRRLLSRSSSLPLPSPPIKHDSGDYSRIRPPPRLRFIVSSRSHGAEL